jgi:hypothetical protein
MDLCGEKGTATGLMPNVEELTPQQRAEILRLCDEVVANYTGRRGRKLYDHRRVALGEISGSVRYEVLSRAGFRCELCGIPADERALEVITSIPDVTAARMVLQIFRRSAINVMPTRGLATTLISALFAKV